MTTARRLDALETALTPTQRVIAWLEEAQAFADLDTYTRSLLSLARQAWHEGADGLFISCTGLPTLDLIAPLEAELGAPVVTSNQASVWAAFDRAGVRDALPGFGRLLAEPTLAGRSRVVP